MNKPNVHLRQRISINHFKLNLLGSQHIPNDPQTSLVLNAMSASGIEDGLDPRTWRGWFSSNPRLARSDAVSLLDECSQNTASQASNSKCSAGDTFYKDLMLGGLFERVIRSEKPIYNSFDLMERISKYSPASTLHLHLDALDAAAISDGIGAIDWEKTKLIFAERVMDILYQLWSPRTGVAYKALYFLEDLGKRPQQNNDSSYSLSQMDMFEEFWKRFYMPDYSVFQDVRDLPSSHIHCVLLALASDADYLHGRRFETWSLDLASAGLALHAASWAKRYEIFGGNFEPEAIYCEAFELLFFRDGPVENIEQALLEVRDVGQLKWTDKSFEILLAARNYYREFLFQRGVSPGEVISIMDSVETAHPMIYEGRRKSPI